MKSLLTTVRFMPLFLTQFLGAFNDNLFKNALIILITYQLILSPTQNAQFLVTIAAGLFILPFFLFSALAGQLADKYDRARIARIVKFFEIIIMFLAGIGFMLQSPWFLIIMLFASGVHSTFFGPIKYALLPQHLKANELLAGNAYIEAGTFLAILLGTISGGILIIQTLGVVAVTLTLLSIAFAGFFTSLYIPKAPAPMPTLKVNYNIVQETIKLIRYSSRNEKIMLMILCVSWFWFIGAIFLAQLPTFVKVSLHTEAKVVTLFLTLFSIGIGIGAFLCNKILQGAVKTSYVALAAFGMSLFIVDLYLASSSEIFNNVHGLYSIQQFMHFTASWRIMADLLFTAIGGGIYIVPLYAVMQRLADKNYLARIIAANNIFNALFMVCGVLFTLGMLALQRTIPEVFLAIGILNLFVAVWLFWHLRGATHYTGHD